MGRREGVNSTAVALFNAEPEDEMFVLFNVSCCLAKKASSFLSCDKCTIGQKQIIPKKKRTVGVSFIVY